MPFFDLPTKRVFELKKGDMFYFAGIIRCVHHVDKKFLHYSSFETGRWKITGTITCKSKMIVILQGYD